MKRLIIAAVGAGALFVGLEWYLKRPVVPPLPAAEPVAEAASVPAEDKPKVVEALAQKPEPPVHPGAAQPAAGASSNTPTASVNPAVEASFLSRTVDTLVSAQASHDQKQEAWKYLGDAGKLDQAIADLEKRIASDPSNAVAEAVLGHAYLHKCGNIKDVREQGILAMQADKLFDTALSLDSSNWEARFMKAVAMSYWPPMLNKGDEVIQHFQTLIDQQEAQAPQPHFAATYGWLGDQYQKAGRTDDAKAVWERGVTLFPSDVSLRTKLAAAK